jgi:pimeloyl-ACP methyl ester carboxylesterase
MAARSRANRDAGTQPRVRRSYFECRYGQLHVFHAMPAGGGFEEETALLCLHETPMTGHMFSGLMGLLGRDRSVYAPDLPGFGQSDSPAAPPTIPDYAAAIGDFLDTMRFRQIDLLGCQTGALIAAELAVCRPTQVRRVILASLPTLNDAQRADFLQAPWPQGANEDGSYLLAAWQRITADAPRPLTLAIAERRLAAALGNGPNGSWGMRAALQYPAGERFGLLKQPVLLVRAGDQYADESLRARELLPQARSLDFPQQGSGWCEAAPQALADAAAKFLRG